jgi:hypothetical protein
MVHPYAWPRLQPTLQDLIDSQPLLANVIIIGEFVLPLHSIGARPRRRDPDAMSAPLR